MNIKIASEKTGLTKKAIKYYESESLINPIKNSENNYRDYSEKDIIKLNLIGALRAVDIPILEIKNVVSGNKSIPEVMKEALARINKNIDSLVQSKLIITNIIDNNLTDYDEAGDQIKKLRETLELSVVEKREFVSNTILRIFPGKYGERLITMYEPFLNISIDTVEKRNSWIKLVKVIDDFDEVSEMDNFIESLNNYNKLDTEVITVEDKKRIAEKVNEVVKWDKKDIDEHGKRTIRGLMSLEEDKETQDYLKKMISMSELMVNTSGEFQKQFSENLSILNPDYKKYLENMVKNIPRIQEEVMKGTGFDIEQWINKCVSDNDNK